MSLFYNKSTFSYKTLFERGVFLFYERILGKSHQRLYIKTKNPYLCFEDPAMIKRNRFKNLLQFSFIGGWAIALTFSHAANPILHGFADPAMRVHDDRMYLAVGKDGDPHIPKGFSMPYWAIYSSTDMVNWRQEKVIDPAEIAIMGKGSQNCWASDIAFRNNKFYFYFSKHCFTTGVLVAEKPGGEYLDVLKRSMIPEQVADKNDYDPTLFTDTEGTPYLIFGRDGKLPDEKEPRHYQIARLNEDMITFAEKPRPLMTDLPNGLGTEKQAQDHSYFHKYCDTYYLSRDGTYMTSKSVYGPFERKREVGQRGGHASYTSYHGQWYHAYEFSDDEYNNRNYRQVMFTYLHYRDNGDMVDDPFFMKGKPGYALGVGNYDAGWEQIEAEWYFRIEGAEKREGPAGGFEVRPSRRGASLTFPKVKNLPENATLNFQVSNGGSKTSTIEVHLGNPEGPILGLCEIKPTGGWAHYKTEKCVLRNPAGESDLCLVFKVGESEPARLDWFAFSK